MTGDPAAGPSGGAMPEMPDAVNAPVAVIIPAFEAARWLPATLTSVLAQTLPPAEVVVVDDGSTDQTPEVVRAFADRGVRLIQQPNAGPGAARNRGLAETGSPLVAFCDADDLWLPDKLATQIPVFADPAVVACCSDAFLLADGVRGGCRLAGRSVPEEINLSDLLSQNPVVLSSVVARRSALLAAGGFDEDRVLIATEDYDLWLRLVHEGRFRFLPTPLLDYRRHGGGLSSAARFAAGLDRIFEKLVRSHPGDQAIVTAARYRRGQALVDLAYECLMAGDGASARRHLAAARALSVGGTCRPVLKTLRIWLKSWLR